MNAKKESFFVKMTKKQGEEMAKDQAQISKVLAKFHAKYGEPVKEVFEANEEGEKVGKMHRKFEVEDRVREGIAAGMKEEKKKFYEQEFEIEELTKMLIEKAEKEKQTLIVLAADPNAKSGKGVVAVLGSSKDCSRLLQLASKATELMEVSIIQAARGIVENSLGKSITRVVDLSEMNTCHCASCRAERDRA